MFIRQLQKSVLVGNLERKVEYICVLILHDLKDMAITGDKNSLQKVQKLHWINFPTTGNRISWQESFGKSSHRFPADSGTLTLPFCGHKKSELCGSLRHFGYTEFTSTQENHPRETTGNSQCRDGTEFPAELCGNQALETKKKNPPTEIIFFLQCLITK